MKKILYVDDAASMRKLVGLVLGKTYDLTIVENGAEALQEATQQKFDAVISDINMPVMNGLEFLEKFRAMPENQFTPILMMTTEASPEMKQQGRDLGATGWIVKPFDPEKLSGLIERACS
ncbi:response regulator [Thiomicrorhabdus indica]|uniref:response regulator n=1 Tax=Thiomicrorhabdus indica TaxID=2267253 RepID=UPI00102DD351|nr:response regulator [Thiomicrorhabdus indica]